MTDLPNRLRELRVEHEEEVYDVAALVRKAASMVTRYETGDTRMPEDVQRMLCDHYGVSLEYLLKWTDENARAEAAA